MPVNDAQYRRLRRVCAEDVFEAYFRYSLGSDMTRAEFLAALARASAPMTSTATAESLAQQRVPGGATRLRRFVDMLRDHLPVVEQVPGAEHLIDALLHVGDLAIAELKNEPSFVTPDDRALVRAVDLLLQRLPQESRRAVLERGLAHAGVSTVARATVILGWPHARYGGKLCPENERSLSSDDLDAVVATAKERIALALKDGSLWPAPHLPLLLWCWQQLGATVDEVRSAVQHASNEGDVFLRLISQLVQVRISRPLGERVGTTAKTINLTTLERLMDVEDTVRRATAVLSGRFALEPSQREALEVLIRAHEERKAGTRDPEQDW